MIKVCNIWIRMKRYSINHTFVKMFIAHCTLVQMNYGKVTIVTIKIAKNTVVTIQKISQPKLTKTQLAQLSQQLILPASLLQNPKLCLKVPFHRPKVFLNKHNVCNTINDPEQTQDYNDINDTAFWCESSPMSLNVIVSFEFEIAVQRRQNIWFVEVE